MEFFCFFFCGVCICDLCRVGALEFIYFLDVV